MLDIKSKLVLKILQKECPGGAYKLVEARDIISALPNKYKVDYDGLENILVYLERQEFISIKYDDEGVFCLCVLPFGNEVLENEQSKKREKNSLLSFKNIVFFTLISFLCSTFGCFLAQILAKILQNGV
jgi:hypothetical protein